MFDKIVNEITATVNEDNIDLQCTISPDNHLVAFIKMWESGVNEPGSDSERDLAA